MDVIKKLAAGVSGTKRCLREFGEQLVRRRIKAEGGRWLPERRLWQLPYRKAQLLQLQHRIVES